MTIEEFDTKTTLRNQIREIDNVLECISSTGIPSMKMGIAVIVFPDTTPFHCLVNGDNVLMGRFKQLLLERKQELIDEFEKD